MRKWLCFIDETEVNIKRVCSDTENINETSPLYLATHYNHLKLTKTLVAARANPNITVAKDIYPSHAAARYGHTHVSNALLTAGTEVHSTHHADRPPLNDGGLS